MAALEPLLTYTVRTSGPLSETTGAPGGTVQYWEVSEARITGDGVDLTLAKPGSDWMRVSDDGFWRPDVRLPLATPAGETVLLHYTGLVEQTGAFKAAAEAGRETTFDDINMRLSLRFETGAPTLKWLTQCLWIGEGRLLGTGHIEYRLYRVT